MSPRTFRPLISLAVACGVALVATAVRAQGVTVVLSPPSQQVAPGAVFDLELLVTAPGSAFNGFDAVIGFDPAALTLQPLSPVGLQEGTLMTAACGKTFHLFQPGPSSASITDVLLCQNQSVTGPGQIYRLRFEASMTPQITHVRFLPGLQFYNDGLFVNPAHSTDAVIGIGMSPVGVEPSPAAAGMRLRIAPNPARGETRFTVDADRAGTRRVRVIDSKGRVVRSFERAADAAGTLTIGWDGRDERGHSVPPGVYVVQLDVEGRTVSNRLALIR